MFQRLSGGARMLCKSPQWSFSKNPGREGRWNQGAWNWQKCNTFVDQSLHFQDNTWCFVTGKNNNIVGMFWNGFYWETMKYAMHNSIFQNVHKHLGLHTKNNQVICRIFMICQKKIIAYHNYIYFIPVLQLLLVCFEMDSTGKPWNMLCTTWFFSLCTAI